jgi:hypothetical protein
LVLVADRSDRRLDAAALLPLVAGVPPLTAVKR